MRTALPVALAALLATPLATSSATSSATPVAIGGTSAPAEDRAPFRFLGVPIMGTVGADQTAEGVRQAIAVAIGEDLDGLVLDIDAREGSLDDGVEIAGLVTAAAENLRTIAIIRRAGGPALPILFACEDWVVLEETPVETRDDRGELVSRSLGPDRLAIQALPARAGTLDAMNATLAATRAACRRAIPGSVTDGRRPDRLVLADALSTPDRDLLITDDAPLTSIAKQRPDVDLPFEGFILPVSDQGPGLTAAQLGTSGLAVTAVEGLDALAGVLGVEVAESYGDIGAALVSSAAEDRAGSRAGLGSRIDSLFASLEGAGQLLRAMPWTLARARLSDPSAPRRAGRLPMVLRDGTWRLSEEAIPFWNRFCDDSIRRWRGVEEVTVSVDQLLDRASGLRAELEAWDPEPADVERLSDALEASAAAFEETRRARKGLDPLVEESRAAVARLESWLKAPPVVKTGPPA